MAPRQAEHRPSLLGIAFVVVCLGGFVASIRVPLGDVLDEELPTREVVAEHAPPAGTDPWEIAPGPQGTDSELREALAVLSPGYAQLVADFGGRLQLTTLDALSGVRTSMPRELSHVVGLYVPRERLILIARDSGKSGWTGLHELGHMIDHALGDLSAQDDFADVFARLQGDERLDSYARSHPRECFAELFARYYFSDRRRRHLAERFPTALQYMAELEARVIACPRVRCTPAG